jgi:hypothetical protein
MTTTRTWRKREKATRMRTLHETADCRWRLEGNTSERVKMLFYMKQIKVAGISGHKICCLFPHFL